LTSLDFALRRAVGFLFDQQDQDGGWRDFQLQKGVSTVWTTAYVAVRLAQEEVLDARTSPALEGAAAFLRRHRHAGGGWGYNGHCMADADSTATALLFLRGRHPAPAVKDIALLAAFQNPDGGFATYRTLPDGHPWRVSNPELTPTVVRALSQFLPAHHVILTRAREWLGRVVLDPENKAYWWTTPAYMHTEMARIGLRTAESQLKMVRFTSVFEAACNLERHALQGRAHEHKRDVEVLIMRQLADGSWPSTPILRVPGALIRPRSIQLNQVPANADQHRIFTTATAFGALGAIRRPPGPCDRN
jgi:hypothetical protein